jgi:hypothetical protein
MSLRQMLLFSAQGMTSSIISAPLASNPSSAAILSTLTVSKQAIYHFIILDITTFKLRFIRSLSIVVAIVIPDHDG